MSTVKYCPLLQLFSVIKSEDGTKRRGDFFWSVGDFSFEKDTIRHIFTGQYYGLHSEFNLDRSGQTKDNSGICCFFAKHAILEQGLVVSESGYYVRVERHVYSRTVVFQGASTKKIHCTAKRVGLLQSRHNHYKSHRFIISSPGVNQHSLTSFQRMAEPRACGRKLISVPN